VLSTAVVSLHSEMDGTGADLKCKLSPKKKSPVSEAIENWTQKSVRGKIGELCNSKIGIAYAQNSPIR
jgi:hypothetical protein